MPQKLFVNTVVWSVALTLYRTTDFSHSKLRAFADIWNSRIRKGKITLSLPVLPSESLSSGEFADRQASLLYVKLDNEIMHLESR